MMPFVLHVHRDQDPDHAPGKRWRGTQTGSTKPQLQREALPDALTNDTICGADGLSAGDPGIDVDAAPGHSVRDDMAMRPAPAHGRET
jgi:hypothetical protein